jgi:uncharacterized repeat protein (TIGR04138 family)
MVRFQVVRVAICAKQSSFTIAFIHQDYSLFLLHMNGANFNEILDLIVREDSRYEKNAYFFMRQCLDYTLKNLREREKVTTNRHITGQELCAGIRDYAIEQYGPMASTLLNSWGLKKTEDFGNIVFNLVEYGVFGKTEKDSQEDFIDVFDFEEAFVHPFLPKSTQKENCKNPSSKDS